MLLSFTCLRCLSDVTLGFNKNPAVHNRRSEHIMSSPVQKTNERDPATPLRTNVHLLNWVEKMANLTKPAAIHWVDGSPEEDEALKAEMVASGTLIKINQELWPGGYYARSHPSDVARVEDRTFICSLSKDAAGPTNNWRSEERRVGKESRWGR